MFEFIYQKRKYTLLSPSLFVIAMTPSEGESCRYISIWFVSCKKLSEQVAFTPWTSLHGSIPSVLFFFFFWCSVFWPLFVWRRVVSQPSTSRTWCTPYYTAAVRRIVYLACIYTCRVLLPLLLICVLLYCRSCCTGCGCSSLCAGWQKLLLVHWIWFHLLFSLSFSNTIWFKYMYPSAMLSHLRPRFVCTTSSVITGMRGVTPAAAKPPL